MKRASLFISLVLLILTLGFSAGTWFCASRSVTIGDDAIAEAQFEIYRPVVGSFRTEGNASVKTGMSFASSVFSLPGFNHSRFLPAGHGPGDQTVTFSKFYGRTREIEEKIIVQYASDQAVSVRHMVIRDGRTEDTGELLDW